LLDILKEEVINSKPKDVFDVINLYDLMNLGLLNVRTVKMRLRWGKIPKEKISYDKEFDIFFINFGKGISEVSIPINKDIVLDINKEKEVTAIEIMNFKRKYAKVIQ